jgi:hypothetical protein
MNRFLTFGIIVLMALAAAACGDIRPPNWPVAPTPDGTLTPGLPQTGPDVVTATVDPLATPSEEETPVPDLTSEATLAPTAVQTEVTAVQVVQAVLLRAGPGPTYDAVGVAPAGDTLEVTGRSTDEAWWQVTCEQGPNRMCWVSADPSLTVSVTEP